MKLATLTVLLGIAAGVGRMESAPIPLLNPSFEALTGTNSVHFDNLGRLRLGHWATFFRLDGAEGFESENAVPGWEGEGENGTMSVITGTGPTARFTAIPDGRNTFFSTSIGLTLQTVTARYTAGNRYVFRVMVGRPLTESMPGVWSGGNLLLLADGEAVAIADIPRNIAPGEFRAVEVAYSVAPGDLNSGKPIGVALSPGFPGEVHFDLATLAEEPLPAIELEAVPAVRLSWPTFTNAWYRVDRTLSLTDPIWTPVSPALPGTSQTVSFFHVATNGAGYYRIVPVPPR